MAERIYRGMEDLVGRTPLMELKRLEKHLALPFRLLAKLEYFNPAGSVKDRAALSIIDEAEKSGRLKPGGVIIEPTSGNTGIALAAIAAARGYGMIVVMPESMSIERRKLAKAYGARVELTDAKSGMKGAIARAEELGAEIGNSIVAGQFVNPANPDAHFRTTGPEIWHDTEGTIDIFVAGMGTGGTITGVGRFLKSRNSDIRIVAVEPAASPVLSGGSPGSHKIQGIGAGFVPEILDRSVIDEIVTVPDESALETARLMGRTEGILVGISGGAALWSALAVGRKPENVGRTVVVMLPDGGERYLSTSLYEES